MIAELTPEQRWMFVGLLLMAGDSPEPGTVYRRKNEHGQPTGYADPILADALGVHESSVQPGLARMVEKGKITTDELGVISICNWGKYQSEYQRQKPYRNPSCNQSDVLEGEVDVDVEGEREKKIVFDANSRRWLHVSAKDKKAWAAAYPACDVDVELARAGEWIIANPAKGRKSNYRRFIVNWLARTQDRGGTSRNGSRGAETADYFDDWAKKGAR